VKQNLTAVCEHISKSEVGNNNNNHHKNITFMFLFLIIGITLLSSSTTIMINAQAYLPTAGSLTSISNNNTSGTSGVKQMGICVVGAGGPCNADSNWDGTHDVTGKCVLINGCGNDNAINKNTNNVISGR
jgi:hypothetical protein